MRLIDQRGDIGMGNMPTQLIPGAHQIAVAGPTVVPAPKGAAGGLMVLAAVRAGRTGAALFCPDDFKMPLCLVLDLAGLLAILPRPVALALGLAPLGFGNPVWLAQHQLRDLRLLTAAHNPAGDFVVHIAYPPGRPRLQPGDVPLDLPLPLRAAPFACQGYLQVPHLLARRRFSETMARPFTMRLWPSSVRIAHTQR